MAKPWRVIKHWSLVTFNCFLTPGWRVWGVRKHVESQSKPYFWMNSRNRLKIGIYAFLGLLNWFFFRKEDSFASLFSLLKLSSDPWVLERQFSSLDSGSEDSGSARNLEAYFWKFMMNKEEKCACLAFMHSFLTR